MRRKNLFLALVLTLLLTGFEGFSQTTRRPVSERKGSAAEAVTSNRREKQSLDNSSHKQENSSRSGRPGYAGSRNDSDQSYKGSSSDSRSSHSSYDRNHGTTNRGHGSYDRGGRGNHNSSHKHNDGYNSGSHGSTAHNNHYRPGGYKPPVNQGYRPHDNHYRPYHHGHYCPPPRRPYRPVYRPVVRPVIPHTYVQVVGVPRITHIIGLAFRTSYYESLDYLYNRGYSVDGYDSGNIYLRDVREMGYNWEDVILNYDRSYLSGAQFIDSKRHGNMKRYRKLYHKLCRKYGAPIEYRGMNKVTWFGHDRRAFITLEYTRSYVNGHRRYYTILSYNYD